jgi:hypothetical protein
MIQVILQRLRLVRRKNENLTNVGVDTIADGKVDQAIAAREANGRFGAVGGEGKEVSPLLAGKDTGDDVAQHTRLLIPPDGFSV